MLTQRLGSETQKNDAFLDFFLDAVKQNPGSCDEVWLASDYGFPSLDTHRKSAAKLKEVAARMRDAGIRVSLQISNTIGHGQYMSARDCSGLVYEGSPVGNMVGPDGTKAEYCFCFRNPELIDYVTKEVRAYAEMQPYCVWVDDDLRVSNHDPVSFGCFCERCIHTFNHTYHYAFDRERLVREINFGDPAVRENYVEFLRDGIYDFTYAISAAVHDVSPESFMGFQYAPEGHTGHTRENVYRAMRDATGKAPKSRPGGGAYADHNPNEILHKSMFLSFQNSLLPEYVTEIRPEIENLPDVVYGKTIAGTCFETSLYLASGANAMSYALLMNDWENRRFHRDMLAAFAAHRDYWSHLCRLSEHSCQGGLRMVMPLQSWKRKLSLHERPFSWADGICESYIGHGNSMIVRSGFPLSFDCRYQPVYVLNAASAKLLTNTQIAALLRCPVLCDGGALEIIAQRGFSQSLSAAAEPLDTSMLFERFADHPVNRESVGKTWSQNFYFKTGHQIIDQTGETQVITFYDSASPAAQRIYDGATYAYGIAAAIVKTSYGASWAVFGGTPWNAVISHDRRTQIMAAADFISNNRLSAVLQTPMQAVLLPRENETGACVGVSVLNCTIGESPQAALTIRRPAGSRFTFRSAQVHALALEAIGDAEEVTVTLPSLAPWSVGTVFIES